MALSAEETTALLTVFTSHGQTLETVWAGASAIFCDGEAQQRGGAALAALLCSQLLQAEERLIALACLYGLSELALLQLVSCLTWRTLLCLSH